MSLRGNSQNMSDRYQPFRSWSPMRRWAEGELSARGNAQNTTPVLYIPVAWSLLLNPVFIHEKCIVPIYYYIRHGKWAQAGGSLELYPSQEVGVSLGFTSTIPVTGSGLELEVH